MSFLSEIYEMLKISGKENDMNVWFMCSKGAVVQGYKKLLKISDQTIVVVGKNKRKIEVCGKFLEIESLAPSELCVSGKIESIRSIDEIH